MKKIITSLLLSLLCITTVNAQIIEPANNSTVESLTDIFITWEGATTIDVNVELMVGGIKAYKIDGENKTFATDVFCGPAWGDCINLTMMNATTDAGDYQIEIPDNMITVDGTAIAAFNLNYTIGGIPTSSATFDVYIENQSVETIYITVSPCEKLELNNDPEIETPFIIKNAGFNSTIASHFEIEITGSNTATLTATKDLAPAHYSLQIPKGTFIVDGKVNPLITREFDNSAVTGVTNDAAAINAYNINGIKVIDNGTQADLDHLQPGVYIVNGEKKVIIRNK